MSFRSRETLQEWLAEFHALDYPADTTIRVIEQDGVDGANTGLVAVLLTSGLSAYIQPHRQGSAAWVVTLESREDSSDLDAAGVSRLSAELATVSALCAFLESKSSGEVD